jgi:hypothetical protein
MPHLNQAGVDRIRIRPALNRGRRLLNYGAAVRVRPTVGGGERRPKRSGAQFRIPCKIAGIEGAGLIRAVRVVNRCRLGDHRPARHDTARPGQQARTRRGRRGDFRKQFPPILRHHIFLSHSFAPFV